MELVNVKKKRHRSKVDLKDVRINIKMTKAERASLKKRAALLNMTMSKYVRSLLWKESEGMKHEE